MRKWINIILEIENDQIKYFGKVSPADQKWLQQKGRKSYAGGELQPIIINNQMVGGIHWDLGGIDYIELKPEFQGTGVLRKIVLDNIEDGKVKFLTASPDLTSKLKNYGSVTHNEETDITTVTIR
ncbi:MAG: hypothetical protein NTW54_07655 [Bacteroidetes bacterium]|nr:hypothetical protein [Bacteroidota bacterium]